MSESLELKLVKADGGEKSQSLNHGLTFCSTFKVRKHVHFFCSKLFMHFPCSIHMVPSQTRIYSRDLWFSILRVSIGADFYIRPRLKRFPQMFPALTCKELSSLASQALSAFFKCRESTVKFHKQGDCFPFIHSPCLTSARGFVIRQVNAGLFKQSEGLTGFLGALLFFFAPRFFHSTREKMFKLELLQPHFPRNAALV